jgi:hypothetical protein
VEAGINKVIATEELTNAQELLDCMEHPCSLLPYVWISDPLLGTIRFKAWDWQPEVLGEWHQNQRNIVLKARQLGVSWLLAVYVLWVAQYHEGANVLVLSKREEEAKALLARIKFIYLHLPAHIRPTLTRTNDSLMEFGQIGAKITALPATEDAGRSEAATMVILDEGAYHPHADVNYGAYKPTIDAGGKLIIVSTANGRGNLFHRLWTGSPMNRFKARFLKWDLRPGRDSAWREQQKAEYAATPELFKQEYPDNAEEAFIVSSGCMFDITSVMDALERCEEPRWVRENGLLRVWRRPVVGRRYVAGGDVAEGVQVGQGDLDYSGVAVYDWQTCVQVADLHGQWPPDVFAQKVSELCKEYNNAFLGVERNNHGHAVLLKLRELKYTNLYVHRDIREGIRSARVNRQGGLGWPTNMLTKPLMETDFGAAVTSGMLVSYDRRLWDEVLSYCHLGNGRTGASQGCHDDRVIKSMIALQMRRRYRPQQSGYGQYEFAVTA